MSMVSLLHRRLIGRPCRRECDSAARLAPRHGPDPPDHPRCLAGGEAMLGGKLDDVDFLSRLFDLSSLPSRDSRHKDMAENIWRHRIINPEDWDDDWVFSDDRLDLLRAPDDDSFGSCARWSIPSCGMRWRWTTWWPPSTDPRAGRLPAGSGGHHVRPPDFGRAGTAGADGALTTRRIANTLSSGHVTAQITRMRANIVQDAPLAIGSAKEFVESFCKGILDARQVARRQGGLPRPGLDDSRDTWAEGQPEERRRPEVDAGSVGHHNQFHRGTTWPSGNGPRRNPRNGGTASWSCPIRR